MQDAIANQTAIERIRKDMLAGRIDYSEAAEQAAPTIKAINEKAKAIAKKHGMRPKLITFSELMR